MKTRFLLAEQVTSILMGQGLIVFSPIVHCHALAERYALPTDFDFWQRYNFGMLRLASELYVLAVAGYEESKGVTCERRFAEHAGIPQMPINQHGMELFEWP